MRMLIGFMQPRTSSMLDGLWDKGMDKLSKECLYWKEVWMGRIEMIEGMGQ